MSGVISTLVGYPDVVDSSLRKQHILIIATE